MPQRANRRPSSRSPSGSRRRRHCPKSSQIEGGRRAEGGSQRSEGGSQKTEDGLPSRSPATAGRRLEIGAPKGRLMTAQGNTLGYKGKTRHSLKGRAK